MALWTGLGQAATVAQLVGADIGGLISMIMQAALTARQNRRECEQLARRVLMIGELLPHVQLEDPAAVRPLAGLGNTLRDAHELVLSCQGRSVAYQLVMSGRQADRFREVQSRIDSYLILFPIVSYIGITRQLNRIYNILVPDDATAGEPSPLFQSTLVQQSAEVAQEVLPHGTEEFRLPEIVAATNNFAPDTKIGEGGYGSVYKGRLYDGREVAIKRCWVQDSHQMKEFNTELAILSRLRHKHIIHLLGWCLEKEKDRRLLSFRRKKQGQEHLIVYEYMANGRLHDHLHCEPSSSPVTVSWKMRIEVLLGVSRAIEHLHCHAMPPVIHRDIKSMNILFDSSWVPRVSDFGISVTWQTMNEEEDFPLAGTLGYIDPEYLQTGRLKLASDVFSLGVLMLEVLTGKETIVNKAEWLDLVPFSLPIIEAGNIGELLDRRPFPEPTPQHLMALEHVAQTAACCVQLQGKDRPVISDIVASLEMALDHITPSTSLADAVHECSLPVHLHDSRPCPRLCPEPAESWFATQEEPEGVLSDSDIPEPR